MEITLPPQLEKYVDEKVTQGLYAHPGEFINHALRAYRERELVVRPDVAGLSQSLPASTADALSSFSEGGDIEELIMIVMMQSARDTDEDLREMMAEMKAMNEAKKRMRELIAKIRQDKATNDLRDKYKSALDFSSGMGSEDAYHHAPLPVVDPAAEGGVRLVPTDLHPGEIVCVSHLTAIQDGLQDKLDGMNELTEMTSLRLQMAMDRRSKFISTLSNIMKKISTTQEAVIQNLK